MAAINIILIAMGILFVGFGYAIRFQKKYHLINHFEADRKSGRLDDRYASRVGWIELIGGIVFILAGAAAFISNTLLFSIIALAVCPVGICTALIINLARSRQRGIRHDKG